MDRPFDYDLGLGILAWAELEGDGAHVSTGTASIEGSSADGLLVLSGGSSGWSRGGRRGAGGGTTRRPGAAWGQVNA